MVNPNQTVYDGSQTDHHASEKYTAAALFNKSNATKFKAIVIASPTNPTNVSEPASLNDLNGFIILSAGADA
jgi:hypothetical protein